MKSSIFKYQFDLLPESLCFDCALPDARLVSVIKHKSVKNYTDITRINNSGQIKLEYKSTVY